MYATRSGSLADVRVEGGRDVLSAIASQAEHGADERPDEQLGHDQGTHRVAGQADDDPAVDPPDGQRLAGLDRDPPESRARPGGRWRRGCGRGGRRSPHRR